MDNTNFSKQYFSVGLVDALNPNSNANSFSVNFNNSALTNIQGVESKTYLTPLLLTLDFDYNNISASALNNTLQVTSTNMKNSPVKITIPDGVYTSQTLIDTIVYLMNRSSATGGCKWSGTAGADANMGWVGGINSSRIYLCWTVDNTGALGSSSTTINTYPLITGTQYNISRPLGYTKSSPNITQATVTTVTSSVPDNIQAVLSPNTSDMRVYDTIRICSSIAKRHFERTNGVLSQTQVLMEIPVYNISIGQTLIWEAMNDLYKQAVVSNFDNMTLEVRDTNGNLIPLKDTCDFNMNFIIEREIPQVSPEDRINSLRNINRLSSV